MGKISLELIAKSHSHTKKRRDETVQQYVRRLTHLYFSEKNIDEIVSKIYSRLFTRSMIVLQGFGKVFIDYNVLYLLIFVSYYHKLPPGLSNWSLPIHFWQNSFENHMLFLAHAFRDWDWRLMTVLFSFICCRIISITAAIYRFSTFMTITFQRSRIWDLQATWLTYIFKKIK